MARGNGRQDIVHDDLDRDRLMGDLGNPRGQTGFRVFSCVLAVGMFESTTCHDDCESNGEPRGQTGGTPGQTGFRVCFLRFGGWHV